MSSVQHLCTTPRGKKIDFLQPSTELHHVPVLPKYMDTGENDDTWCYITPSFFMTMQGVTPLLMARTSCDILRRCQWEILKHPQ